MGRLAAAEPRSDTEAGRRGAGAAADPPPGGTTEGDGPTNRTLARVRWLMLISGLTTLIAIAAVAGVIGYRIFHVAGSGGTAPVDAVVALPQGARVIATGIAEDHIVVTLELSGATEIRTYDVRSLQETGRIRFAPAP
jgi:hypothetical protein